MKLRDLRIDFLRFHSANPHVYSLFDRFAWEAIKAGREVLSASLIFERIRWETTVLTSDTDFKLNNNHRAYYARLWMNRNPEIEVIFRTRTVVAERRAA